MRHAILHLHAEINWFICMANKYNKHANSEAENKKRNKNLTQSGIRGTHKRFTCTNISARKSNIWHTWENNLCGCQPTHRPKQQINSKTAVDCPADICKWQIAWPAKHGQKALQNKAISLAKAKNYWNAKLRIGEPVTICQKLPYHIHRTKQILN